MVGGGGVDGDNWKVAGGAERSASFVESVWECFVFAQAEVLLDGEVVGGVSWMRCIPVPCCCCCCLLLAVAERDVGH